MRIQHNIPAMNSYRNYSGNVSKVSKSLEKLSTGYRVNRAGDDAAGLAISEKMRIQMSGLEQAQTNAKAGINLVQTAEGALTEVHDMLNRMFTLAEQSANGTYDNTTDRKQLQKEVTALKDEINRIADSSNYNGIKLLDGSLEEGGVTSIEVFGNATATTSAGTVSTGALATGFTAATVFGKNGDRSGCISEISLTDDKGNAYSIKLKATSDAIIDMNSGASYALKSSTTGVTDDDVVKAMKGAIRDATGNAFELVDGKTIQSLATGSRAATISGAGAKWTDEDGKTTATDLGTVTKQLPKTAKVMLKGVTDVDKTDTVDDMKKNMFSINGQKFLYTTDETQIKAISEKLGEADVTVVFGDDLASAASQIAKATGLSYDADETTGGTIALKTGSGSALRLQIGDTPDDFNKLSVSVDDCHTTALGIAGVDISSQGGAATALSLIKAATNKVSDVRGGLGALQNRLDHTINNLSVAQENITEAESTIRDTDVAKEMMNYTKNNILVQSAQAMLAQANQLPQGVLQLLG